MVDAGAERLFGTTTGTGVLHDLGDTYPLSASVFATCSIASSPAPDHVTGAATRVSFRAPNHVEGDAVDSLTVIIVLTVVLAVVVAAVIKSVAVVPPGNVGLVERLGRYSRTLPEGLSIIGPFVDQVRVVPTGEQVLTLAAVNPITSDNRTVVVEPVLHIEVVDPIRATYEIADYRKGVETLTDAALRSAVEGMPMTEVLESREVLQQVLSRTYVQSVGDWGLKVNRIDLSELRPA